jgi:hypothetical protein
MQVSRQEVMMAVGIFELAAQPFAHHSASVTFSFLFHFASFT